MGPGVSILWSPLSFLTFPKRCGSARQGLFGDTEVVQLCVLFEASHAALIPEWNATCISSNTTLRLQHCWVTSCLHSKDPGSSTCTTNAGGRMGGWIESRIALPGCTSSLEITTGIPRPFVLCFIMLQGYCAFTNGRSVATLQRVS